MIASKVGNGLIIDSVLTSELIMHVRCFHCGLKKFITVVKSFSVSITDYDKTEKCHSGEKRRKFDNLACKPTQNLSIVNVLSLMKPF